MSALAIGLALAVAASVALNLSFVLQHAGSATAPAISPLRPLATLHGLLRSPLWVGGAAVGMTGWALHVAALSHAPLSLVQAFVAGGLALVAPVATRLLGERLAAPERRAVVLMVGALVLLSLGIGRPPARAPFSGAELGAYLALTAVVALAFVARPVAGWRANALGLAGGLFYGMADMAIKALTDVASGGLLAAAESPWLLVAALSTVAAFFSFQRGLQAGRAVPVIALMTAGTNVASVLGGLVVFGDPLGHGLAQAVLHLAGFALVGVAAWQLAPVQALIAVGEAPTVVVGGPPETGPAGRAEPIGANDPGPPAANPSARAAVGRSAGRAAGEADRLALGGAPSAREPSRPAAG